MDSIHIILLCVCLCMCLQGEKGEPGVMVAADGSMMSGLTGPQGPKGIKVSLTHTTSWVKVHIDCLGSSCVRHSLCFLTPSQGDCGVPGPAGVMVRRYLFLSLITDL